MQSSDVDSLESTIDIEDKNLLAVNDLLSLGNDGVILNIPLRSIKSLLKRNWHGLASELNRKTYSDHRDSSELSDGAVAIIGTVANTKKEPAVHSGSQAVGFVLPHQAAQ